MAYPSTANNLAANHVADQVITSADQNKVEVDVNQLTLRAGTGTTTPSAGKQWTGTGTGTSEWQFMPVATKTAAYTATDADWIILCNATSGAFSITLPTAVGRAGKEFRIKKTDASVNAVTIGTTSSQTTDGATTQTLLNRWDGAIVVSDNANWVMF